MMNNDNFHTETMTQYNGWTNYETWRVNMEMFDGLGAEDFALSTRIDQVDLTDPDTFADVCGELAISLEDFSESLTDGLDGLVLNLVESFLQQVDWTEIAEAMLENYRTEAV